MAVLSSRGLWHAHGWPSRATGVAAGVLATAATVAACSPEIGPGAYYCGPELLCPPDLVCDEPTFTCELPATARPFACPPGSEDGEPDDTPVQARDLGALVCGEPLLVGEGFDGCIAGPEQVDMLMFQSETECVGDDPRLQIVLRFPIASVPLTAELLDGDGGVVSTATDCTPIPDFTGTRRRCIEIVPRLDVYYLRIAGEPGGSNCDGACGHNQYALTILFPLA